MKIIDPPEGPPGGPGANPGPPPYRHTGGLVAVHAADHEQPQVGVCIAELTGRDRAAADRAAEDQPATHDAIGDSRTLGRWGHGGFRARAGFRRAVSAGGMRTTR